MDALSHVARAGVAFSQNIIGIVTRPYETYRRIVDRGTSWEMVYVGILLAFYFALASLVKTAAFRPFLLTRQFILLVSAASVSFLVTVGVLWVAGRMVGGEGKLSVLVRAWAYTLVPTVLWFLFTSVLYVVLPPPRTTSALGVAFSVVFLLCSVMLFWWKLQLGYLALRFGMRLDLLKIMTVAVVAAVVLGFYSAGMYKLGIFKVPFL